MNGNTSQESKDIERLKKLYSEAKKLQMRMFWGEFKRSKMGMIGLSMLLAFISISLSVPLIFPADFIYKWRNPVYWSDNPPVVPPEWWFRLTGTPYFPQTLLYKSWQEGTEYAVVTFKYDASVLPRDIRVTIMLRAEDSADATFYFSVYRPDGNEIVLKREVIVLNLAKGESKTIEYDYFFESDKKLKRELLSYFGFLEVDPIKASAVSMIFGKMSEDMWSRYRAEPLNGMYVFKAVIRGKGVRVVSLRIVLKGTAYGFMGTDNLGRDLFLGLMWGFPIALLIGVSVSVASVMISLFYGMLSGYFGGMTDEVLQRIVDIFYCIPQLPILILCAMVFGPHLSLIILLLVILSWPGGVKTIRAMALQIRESVYIEAARLSGASHWWIIFKHMMPQVLPYAFASMALGVPGAILAEAGLSFLGLGDPSLPTWGQILHDAQAASATVCGYWWWVIPPGLLIGLIGLTFALIGTALNRILNPRLRY